MHNNNSQHHHIHNPQSYHNQHMSNMHQQNQQYTNNNHQNQNNYYHNNNNQHNNNQHNLHNQHNNQYNMHNQHNQNSHEKNYLHLYTQHGGQHHHNNSSKNTQQAYFNKIMMKIKFINKYEKCFDFSNYKSFSNLNLRFLKQNFKIKDQHLEIDDHNKRTSLDMQSKYNEMELRMRSQSFTTGNTNNSKNANNYHNDTNSNNQFSSSNQIKNVNPNAPTGSSPDSKNLHLKNNSSSENFNFIESRENISILNKAYYESLKLQPYAFIKDENVIDENLKIGQYLKGEIRINKCHTHAYITVEGIENDILIRGNRNLNQSFHLDEVIVELFPIICWKPLFNKKIKKPMKHGEGGLISDYTDNEKVDFKLNLIKENAEDAIQNDLRKNFEFESQTEL